MRDEFALIRKILTISILVIMLVSLLVHTNGNLKGPEMTALINGIIDKAIVKTEEAEITRKFKSNLPKDIMIHKVVEPATQDQYEAELLNMVDTREFTREFKYRSKKLFKTFDEEYKVISDALSSISSKYPEYMSYLGEINVKREDNGILSKTTVLLIPRLTSANNKSIGEMLDVFELEAINVIEILKEEGRISETQTEREKAKILYTWIVQNTKYINKNSIETSSGYGQIINGEAVCQGYVSSYNYLLRLVGIENVKGIVGDVDGGAHIWTEAILDGERVLIDVTFGDPLPDRGDKVDYNYFGINEMELRKTHSW